MSEASINTVIPQTRKLYFYAPLAQSIPPAAPKPAGVPASALAPDKPIPATVESALLRGDWERVHKALGGVAADKLTPSERFAWGHACLACNDGNRALAVFISATDDQAHSWRNYTESLARIHADNAVAHYLHGDALARCGDLVSARKSFDRALSLKSNMAMAWNARGVCCTLLGDMGDALNSFTKATEAEQGFADAHVSLGCYWVLTRVSDAARDEFLVAKDKQKDSALAWNGLGCAEFGSGNMDAAYADFATATDLSPALAIAWANQGQILASVATASKQPATSDNANTSLSFTSEPNPASALTPDRVKQLAASGGIPAALHDLAVKESGLKAEARSLSDKSQSIVKEISFANDINIGLAFGTEAMRVLNTAQVGATKGLPAALAYAYEEAVWEFYGKSSESAAPNNTKTAVRFGFAAVDPHDGRIDLGGLFKQLFVDSAEKNRDAMLEKTAQINYQAAALAAQARDLANQKRLLGAATSPSTSSVVKNVVPPISVDRPQPRNPLPPDNVRPKPPAASNPPLFPPNDRLPNVTHDDHFPGQPPSFASHTLPWEYTKPVIPQPRAEGVITSVAGAHVDKGDWPVITFFTLAYRLPAAHAKEHRDAR